MTALAKLTLKRVERTIKLDKAAERRNKFVAAVDQQLKLVEANMRGEDYRARCLGWRIHCAKRRSPYRPRRLFQGQVFALLADVLCPRLHANLMLSKATASPMRRCRVTGRRGSRRHCCGYPVPRSGPAPCRVADRSRK